MTDEIVIVPAPPTPLIARPRMITHICDPTPLYQFVRSSLYLMEPTPTRLYILRRRGGRRLRAKVSGRICQTASHTATALVSIDLPLIVHITYHGLCCTETQCVCCREPARVTQVIELGRYPRCGGKHECRVSIGDKLACVIVSDAFSCNRYSLLSYLARAPRLSCQPPSKP